MGEAANVAISVLNKVVRYAVTLGVGASIAQTSLYTGESAEWPSAQRIVRRLLPHAP